MNFDHFKILFVGDAAFQPRVVAALHSAPVWIKYDVEHLSVLPDEIALLAAREYDIILIDADFLGVTGMFAILRRDLPGVPVIVLADAVDHAFTEKMLGNGAQDVLAKNIFDTPWFERAVRSCAEKYRLARRLERSSEDRFRHLIERSADGMVVVNMSGIVVFINPAVETIFERSGEEIVGCKFDFHLLARRQRDASALDDLSLKYVSLLAKSGKTTELEISLEGDVVKLVEMRATEVLWADYEAFLIVFHDITSLMRLQRLKAEMFERERIAKLKDEFISTVSHELRTPLAIVKCAVENMKDGVMGDLSQRQERIVKIASSNVDRLTKLIDDILDLSRLEAGSVRIAPRELAVDLLILETVRRFSLLAKERGIDIVPQVPPGMRSIHADIDKVTQVLDNLLSNALRFAKAKVTVRVQMASDGLTALESVEPSFSRLKDFLAVNTDGVLVSVTDDGPGIPGDKLDHLFGKFVQIDRPSGGAGYKGTGLGLAICKEIIELHDGRIWAESDYGDGARFHFILPRYRESFAEQGVPVG